MRCALCKDTSLKPSVQGPATLREHGGNPRDGFQVRKEGGQRKSKRICLMDLSRREEITRVRLFSRITSSCLVQRSSSTSLLLFFFLGGGGGGVSWVTASLVLRFRLQGVGYIQKALAIGHVESRRLHNGALGRGFAVHACRAYFDFFKTTGFHLYIDLSG